MYLTREKYFLLAAGVVLVALIAIFVLFFVSRTGKPVQEENKNVFNPEIQTPTNERKPPFDEQKPIRTQEEIWPEYEKNINNLLNLVNTSTEDADATLAKVEAGFFDIFVPNEKKDLHFQTLLRIQKLKSDGSIDSREKMREYIVPLLDALLEKAE